MGSDLDNLDTASSLFHGYDTVAHWINDSIAITSKE